MLQSNRLTAIHSKVFKILSKLQYLDLSSNQISFINEYEFNFLNFLVQLNLKNNKLEFLYTNLIKECYNLRNFCLYGNLFPENFQMNFNGLNNLNKELYCYI